jgi:tetratricopeptide (TPR) repeat protein
MRFTFGITTCVLALATTAFARADFIPVRQPPLTLESSGLPKGIGEIDQAIAAFDKGEYERCQELLKAAAKKLPDLSPPRVLLARLFYVTNQLARTRAALELAAVENPEHPETYLLFGKVALQEGRVTDAALQFDKAIGLVASGKWKDDVKHGFLIEGHGGLAGIAERRNDWRAAEAALSAWLVVEAKNGKTRQRLGTALFHQGKHDAAFEELQRAVKDEPSLWPAEISMGHLFTEKKDADAAKKWMESAVTRHPKAPRAHLGVAIWLLEHDQVEKAKTEADAAARLDPESADIKALVGLIAWHTRSFEEAERIFQGLYAESPANFTASNLLALALVEQSAAAKRRRALELAEINARLYPKSGEALTTLGLVYYRHGRHNDAEQALRAALATTGASSDTAYYLARLLFERGQSSEVAQLLKLALDAPGRFTFRKEAQAWAAQLGKQP